MNTVPNDPGHGDSPAAWTSVVVMLIGIAVGTAAFFLNLPWLVWASVAVVVIGAILGFVLARAGYGVKGPKYTPKTHD